MSKNNSNTQRFNEVPGKKFTTTPPNCTGCNTVMKEHYVAIWHDKYICPKCDYFQGIPTTVPAYHEEEDNKKGKKK